MEALGIDQAELANRTGFSLNHISQVINGEKRLTPHTAVRLESATGVPARLWNKLEIQFQERCHRLKLSETEVRRHPFEDSVSL